eukprot:1365274-Ditylum_brightwellii.AAC.1
MEEQYTFKQDMRDHTAKGIFYTDQELLPMMVLSDLVSHELIQCEEPKDIIDGLDSMFVWKTLETSRGKRNMASAATMANKIDVFKEAGGCKGCIKL